LAIGADPDLAPLFSDDELARARQVVPPPLPDDVRAIRRRLGLKPGTIRRPIRVFGRNDPQL
jgi:hypothetical protein